MKYTLYHIKGFKWGCTEDIDRRLYQQGYKLSDCCEFEYYDDIHEASKREAELNKICGYDNQHQYYAQIVKVARLPKTREAVLKSHIGRTISDEHKKILSKTHKGKYNGSKSKRSVLTESQVLEIRDKYKPFVYTTKKLANEYNVSEPTIQSIIYRKTWRHI